MPGLGGLVGSRESAKAKSVRMEMMSATWLVTTIGGSLLLVWERSFLGLWVGERYYPGTTAMVLIVVMVLQFALIRNDSNIIDHAERAKESSARARLRHLVRRALVVPRRPRVGDRGARVGVHRRSIDPHAGVPFDRRQTARSVADGADPWGDPTGVLTCLLFSVTAYAGIQVRADSWITLVAGGAATAIVVAPVARSAA